MGFKDRKDKTKTNNVKIRQLQKKKTALSAEF